MAVRADFDKKFSLIKQFQVDPAGSATVAGKPVKFSTSGNAADTVIAPAVAADSQNIIGFADESQPVGAMCNVVLTAAQIIPVTVGTGGSTRGLQQKIAADGTGVTDVTGSAGAPAAGEVVVGRAYQSGVAGDLIGLLKGGV